MENLKWLTVTQAAERVGLKPAMLRRHCQAGRVAGAVKIGWSWLIPSEALADFRAPGKGWQKGRRRKEGV